MFCTFIVLCAQFIRNIVELINDNCISKNFTWWFSNTSYINFMYILEGINNCDVDVLIDADTHIFMKMLSCSIFNKDMFKRCMTIVNETDFFSYQLIGEWASIFCYRRNVYIFYHRDFNGHNVFYYIDNCNYLTCEQKAILKNAIVQKFLHNPIKTIDLDKRGKPSWEWNRIFNTNLYGKDLAREKRLTKSKK